MEGPGLFVVVPSTLLLVTICYVYLLVKGRTEEPKLRLMVSLLQSISD